MSASRICSVGSVALLATSIWSASAAFGQCVTTCPPGAVQENDECGGIDPDPNGGCNVSPELYQDLGVIDDTDVTVCGTVGTFGDSLRDLDWYRFELEQSAFVTVTAHHEVSPGSPAPNFTIFIISGDDCDTQVTEFAAASAACPFTSDTIELPAGSHVVIFTVNSFAPEEPACPVTYTGIIDVEFGDFPICGDAGAGSCTEPHGTGGCNNFGCCETVCAFNPLCCDVEWDADCVDLAVKLCGLFIYECEPAGGAPPNDCATAATLLEIDESVAFNTANANTDGPPDTGCTYGKDIWAIVQAPDNGELNVDVSSPTFDSTIALYALGNSPTFDPATLPNLLIGCVDALGVGAEGLTLLDAVEGDYYLIQVAGFDDGGGPQSGAGTLTTSFVNLLWDTGNTNAVNFDAAGGGNFTLTNLGWSSGCLGAGSEQRWNAQAFTLPPSSGPWHLTAIHAYGFTPAGVTNTTLEWIIWERTGQAAPVDGDQVISGSIPFPTPTDLPGGAATEDHEIPVDFDLPAGDYYLTVFGANDNCPGTPANFAWFTNAPNGINLIDPPGAATGPFAWRSAQFPAPGFVVYQLGPNNIQQADGLDPNDVYNAGFRILGTGEGSKVECPADLDGSGAVDGADLGTLLGNWGGAGAGDLDGSGTVDGGDLGILLGSWGACG